MKLNFQLIIILLFVSTNVSLAQNNDFKRYSIKSAIVEYELSGMQIGTAITYFDNYGMQETTYESSVIDMFGVTQEAETVNYLQGYWQYNLDLKTNTGTKTKNTVLESLVESSDGDLEQVGLDMFKSMGGKKVGAEEILGKLCDVWELTSMGTKVWVWKNIPLKSETKMMGMEIIRSATILQENVKIPSDKMEIPKEIEFKEIDISNLDKMMQGIEDEYK